jgi:hypothetical protein
MSGVKRSQAAFEFLLNYAWAFLIILVVLSVLATREYNQNSASYVSEKCLFTDGLSCTEFASKKVGNDVVLNVNLKNTAGKKFNVNTASASFENSNVSALSNTIKYSYDGVVYSDTLGALSTVVMSGSNFSIYVKLVNSNMNDDFLKTSLTVNYQFVKEGYFPKSVSGVIVSKIV